jgi:two-component system, OmpR family, response regulator
MKRHRLLVVEDDLPTLESLRDLFRRAGFDVETATTGRDALGCLLDGENPAAIVLDARMPVMSGEELVTVMRAYRRLAAIPVLLLTGIEVRDSFVQHVELVMRKPFRADELIAGVEELVNRAEAPA